MKSCMVSNISIRFKQSANRYIFIWHQSFLSYINNIQSYFTHQWSFKRNANSGSEWTLQEWKKGCLHNSQTSTTEASRKDLVWYHSRESLWPKAKVLDYGFDINECDSQERSYVYFRSDTLENVRNPLIPPALV